MTGFRKSAGGGSGPGRFGIPGIGVTATAPFSQAQILHLMKTEFARARRYGYPVSCILMRIDRLQGLCDLHGTELRDRLREHLTRLVRDKTRGADHLGIVSEDRYLLVLPHTDEHQALAVAERIRSEFAELEVESRGSRLPLTLSLGVAAFDDEDTLFFDTMLSRAEVALEWAADAGGDQVSVFRRDRFTKE